MAKKEKEEEKILDIPETLTRTEAYIEENKNSLTLILVVVVAIIGGYFLYDRVYVAGQEEEARAQMYMAELYFRGDSLEKAVNGDGQFPGFIEIRDEYGVTKSANLAHYCLGISYLHKGMYEDAIEELKEFDSDDAMLGPIALGAIGDAYLELGDRDKALSFYLDAADKDGNDFTMPLYLKKAAIVHELLGEYDDAIRLYTQIRKQFPESDEAGTAEKYLGRNEARKAAAAKK